MSTTRPRVNIIDTHVTAFSFHIRRGDEFWWAGRLYQAVTDADLIKLSSGVMAADFMANLIGEEGRLPLPLVIPVDEPIAFLEKAES